ncbi:hypothetical protein SCHPADRAFT_263459 [Schizopora paradoxa]|uniref:NACHT domain-containing protein n=1 Tax=Schizopora paradoxa TaxID=27342 RepID=A0A0H2RU14_9AGAM|nr:hypothetical protein SCHPADRAFT_263459 [Schizopora paradoxa]
MWKQQHEFKENLGALARDMITSLESMVEAYSSMESKHARETVTKLVRFILRASAYVESFSKNDGFSKERSLKERLKDKALQTMRTQFPKKLDDYRHDLKDCRLDFREAILVDVLVKKGVMKDRDDVSLLQSRLKPSEQLDMDDGWLEGSRARVMSDVDTWLRSCDKPNVLWISGAPGAGKSAIASKIVRKKLLDRSSEFCDTHRCGRFFIKRGNTALDDPRTIWRSIAMGLVNLSTTVKGRWCRSIKVDLLEAVSQSADVEYPKNLSIEEQFRDLICGPLKKLFEITADASRRIVIVIDALDECNRSDGGDKRRWGAFLDTIKNWSIDLPKTCKLVLTSRVEPEIVAKLKGISLPLELDTGEGVSDESTRDIVLLFEKGFEGKGVGRTHIEKLAKYTAGLFVWATTVIEYINEGDFDERLKEVLDNLPKAGAQGDSDKIGILYGQILFPVAWERRTHPDELDRLSLVLASVIPGILRRPLPIRALGALLSPNPEAINHIVGVAGKLNSIIASDGTDKTPCTRHKSFPDFLSDGERVKKTMMRIIDVKARHADGSERAVFLNAFSLVHQRALVAKSCLQLMVQCTKASDQAGSLNTDISTALVYACTHWVDHIPDADADAESDTTRGFYSEPLIYSAPPGETLPCLQERTLHWLKALCLSEAGLGRGAVLHKSVMFVNVLHELWSFLATPSEILLLEAMRRFAIIHPFLDRVKTALEVAGGLTEEKRNITKALIMDMCDSLMYVTGDHPEAEREYAKISAAELTEIVVQSSRYVINFASKDVAPADFRMKISDYRNQVRDCHREAVLIPNLIGRGFLKDGGDIESLLHRKLEPVEQALDDERCLEGTREQILSSVYDWLTSEEANVLWISGLAGVGKTALASTIVEKVSRDPSYRFYNCAKFFIKERDVNLRDPRAIWQSISAQLASESFNRGIKLDLLEFFSGAAGVIYPGQARIQDQFRDLIREPLQKWFPSESVSSRRILVVVDALDECGIHSQDERSTFLDTVVSWSKELPRTCKLLVTSRPEADIEGKLNCSVIRRVKVESGDKNSRASDHDIGRFFETRFEEMEVDERVRIPDLTRAANGVFAWATTISEFIRCNFAKRPHDVKELLDVVAGESNAREDNLDYLYGQILSKVASQLSGPQDQDILSVVLASVSLPRNPITFVAVCELLPPDCPSSSVKSVIDKLGPVIHLTGNKRNLLRARHRSFSDFLRKEDRYKTTMDSVANTSSVKHDAFFSALALERQRSVFEGGYLRLINKCCQRVYPLLIEFLDGHVQRRDEQWIKDITLCWSRSENLEPDRRPSDQIDALFLLTEAWLRCQNVFVSTEIKAFELRTIVDMCQWLVSTDGNSSYIWFVFVALLDPNAVWSGKQKYSDNDLVIKLLESLKSSDTSESGSKQSAMRFLESLAAALECVADYTARSSETHALTKYRAFLGVYQSSMRYWELELRGAMSRNLEGVVDVDWSSKIGDGAFAVVYKGSASLDNGVVEVAVRVLSNRVLIRNDEEPRRHQLIEQGFIEASHVRGRFNHQNVLKSLGYMQSVTNGDPYSIATVYPLVEGGNISNIELEIKKAFAVSLDVAKGMCFLHHIGVIHGNLKSVGTSSLGT